MLTTKRYNKIVKWFLRKHTRKIHTLAQFTKKNERVEGFVHSTLEPNNDLHKTQITGRTKFAGMCCLSRVIKEHKTCRTGSHIGLGSRERNHANHDEGTGSNKVASQR
jgi:hypothetical protein